MTHVTTPRLLGAAVPRGEDPLLLTGAGAYVPDLPLGEAACHVVFVRSPHAHARLRSLDTGPARAAPGVLAVVTAGDLPPGLELPIEQPAAGDMNEWRAPPRRPLARDRVRFVGEPIAAIVATSHGAAEDAAEVLSGCIDYEALPAVMDPEASLAAGAPLLYEEFGTNLAHRQVKRGGDVDAAFSRSDVTIVRARITNQRVLPVPLEPRGAAARWDPGSRELTFWSSTQVPHTLRTKLAAALDLPENHVRVIAPDVGGGFGAKIEVSTEEVITAWVARLLGRPARWVEGRRENFQAMVHGRGQINDVEAAVTVDGEVVGLKVHALADLGAAYQYTTSVIATLTPTVLPGPYRTPAVLFDLRGAFTNKTPVGAYRGAGRPEATFLLERVMDLVARRLGLDPSAVRQRNFLAPDQFPYRTPLGSSYDSGNYQLALERLLQAANYSALRGAQAAARTRCVGPLIGIGLGAYVEICGFGPWESATVRVEASGKVTALAGTSPHGQGHATTFAQIVADRLAIPLGEVVARFNDTAIVPTGIGTFGSRSAALGGSAVLASVERVREKVLRIAADVLEAAPDDLEMRDGRIALRGVPDRAITLAEVARRAYAGTVPIGDEPGLEATCFFAPGGETFPFGMHLAVVHIDRETGRVRLERFVAIDDCGRVINPRIADGQRHGGIAQGMAQALLEQVAYDDQGQLLSSSLGDYAVPRASDLPRLELDRTETPTHRNPLGVKGVGEAGTIGSTPAVANAVLDALAPLGIEHLDMPLTSERIWRVMREARSESAGR